MVIDPDLFKEVTVKGLPFRNIYGSYSQREKREIKDPKVRTKKEHNKPREFVKGLPFFSTSDFSLQMMRGFMEELFPEN
jgi:hypothetical protein